MKQLRGSALLAALPLLILLLLALRSPAPYTIDVGAAGDAYALATFHHSEQQAGLAMRWSAPGARLLLPATYDGPLALKLRLQPPPAAPASPRRLELVRDGAVVSRIDPGPGWRVYRLLLPPDRLPEPVALAVEPLELRIAPGFGPGDPRPLGVGLDWLSVRALGAAPWGPLLARAGGLAWLGGLILAALDMVRRRSAAWMALLPLLAVGSGLAWWAWQAPLSFAWFVPAPPWWLLSLATLLLIGWDQLRGIRPGFSSQLPLPGILPSWPLLLATILVGLLLQRTQVGALLITLLPGALAARLLFPEERALATQIFLSICGALAVAALLMLGLAALPGALPGPLPVLLNTSLSLVLLIVASPGLRQWLPGRCRVRSASTPSSAENAPQPQTRAPGWREQLSGLLRYGQAGQALAGWQAVAGVALLVGLALRLAFLGSAEFQGDEARAMLLALGLVRGEAGLLLSHTKGPVEALLPALVLAVAGHVSMWAARLPFALASLGVLAASLALTNEEAGSPRHPIRVAGVIALAMLAVDGFAVAFARIVQYQSIVMLMMAGAYWNCRRFYEGAPGGQRHLTVAAVLLAVGLLAHYDAVMVVPALAWLVLAGGWRRGWHLGDWMRGLALPVLLGAGLLASFYLPYVRAESFAQTARYLAGRAGEGDGGGPPFNNLGLYLRILAIYSGPYLTPLLAAGMLTTLAGLLISAVKPRWLGLAAALLLFAAGLSQWLTPQLLVGASGASWAGVAFGLPLGVLALAPGLKGPQRAVVIWFGVAFAAQAFLIAEPRTHFYTAHLPAALLIGSASAQLLTWATGTGWRQLGLLGRRGSLIAALTLLWPLAGWPYARLAYLQQVPEYQRSYPAAQPAWLGPPGETSLPEAGYFGFPHRDGWQVVAELYRRGVLRGSYDSNQNRWLVGWYLGGLAQQCKGAPDYYLIAEAETTVYFPPGYHMIAEVTVGPGRMLAIYGREPPPEGLRSYALEDLPASMSAHPSGQFDLDALLNGDPPACAN